MSQVRVQIGNENPRMIFPLQLITDLLIFIFKKVLKLVFLFTFGLKGLCHKDLDEFW